MPMLDATRQAARAVTGGRDNPPLVSAVAAYCRGDRGVRASVDGIWAHIGEAVHLRGDRIAVCAFAGDVYSRSRDMAAAAVERVLEAEPALARAAAVFTAKGVTAALAIGVCARACLDGPPPPPGSGVDTPALIRHVLERGLRDWVAEEMAELGRADDDAAALDAHLDALGLLLWSMSTYPAERVTRALDAYDMAQVRRGRPRLPHREAVAGAVAWAAAASARDRVNLAIQLERAIVSKFGHKG